MTMAVTTLVEMSHDASSWTDVTGYVLTEGVQFQRGRSRILSEWQPGTWTAEFENTGRHVDPTNDAATFQARPGDWIRVSLNGAVHFFGRLDTAGLSYAKGPVPVSRLTLSGSDSLAWIGRATVHDPNTVGFTVDTGSHINTVLALANLSFAATTPVASVIASGDVSVTMPNTGAYNALTVVQTLVRTEGGNSQLFTAKTGALTFRSRYSKPSQVVAFGGTGVPYTDIDADFTQDEFFNVQNLTPIAHLDTESSPTSVTAGTGTKTFTLTALGAGVGFGFSAGATVVATSQALGQPTMTGTVTSFNETTRVMVTSVASFTGSGTKTDWAFDLTEPSTVQSATDAQSFTRYHMYAAKDVATYHRSLPATLVEARILAATAAHPSRRINTFTVELGGLTAGQKTSVLSLEIGDAAQVAFDLGSGDPQTLTQTRRIDGIAHRVRGDGSHRVTFILGQEVTLDFTCVVKQNAASVASTKLDATYTDRDGWVTAHLNLTITAAGTNNTELKITPTSLPAPFSTDAGNTCGIFRYYDASAGHYIGAGSWDGTDITFKVNQAATNLALGLSPVFAAANGDAIIAQLKFRRS